MREIRPSGSAGGAGQLNAPFLPRSTGHSGRWRGWLIRASQAWVLFMGARFWYAVGNP